MWPRCYSFFTGDPVSFPLPHSFRCRTHILPVLCPPKAEPLFELSPTPFIKPRGRG